MVFWRAVGLVSALFLLMMGVAGAAPERRVALVIGNGRYENVARLPNPGPDAEMVAASLREAVFATVLLATVLTRENLVDALQRFSAEAERADWAVVYYAGHGIEMNGMNYLIPIDARLKTDRDLQFEAVPMSQVLGAVDGARRLRLLVLDACRDNPFAASMSRGLGATRSIGRGLARIEPEAGTLVAYAAKHGQVAEDGAGAHSPFVASLVKHIATPGLEINRLFRKVTSDVLVATNRRQEPFTYGSLPDEDFYFRDAVLQPVRTEPAPAAALPEKASVEPPQTVAVPPTAPPKAAVKTPDPPPVAAVPAVPVAPIETPAPQPEPRNKVASVDPAAPPAVVARPVVPPVKERPIARPKPVRRPEPIVSRPKRVAQAVERPEPRAVRPAPRVKAVSAARGGAGRCFTFNGERVCE